MTNGEKGSLYAFGFGAFGIDSGFGFRNLGFLIVSLLIASFAAAQVPSREKPAVGAGTGQEKIVVDDKTEQVIRGALKYLASKQNTNGSWTASDGERQEVAMTVTARRQINSCYGEISSCSV